MPVFVYDVEGWAWHQKAGKLMNEFTAFDSARMSEKDAAAMGTEDRTYKAKIQQMIFFSPQQYERVRLQWEFANFNCFVGASFPAELPALAALDGKVAGIFVNNRRMQTTLAAVDVSAWLIPNGVDCEFWNPGIIKLADPLRGPLRVGWVGNSRHHTHGGRAPHKGFSIIAEACARSGAVLIAKDSAGDYSGDSYWSPTEIRDRIYHQIDVLAVASEMEGTPNPALEAMACGVPVVTTPVGDAAEVIAKYGQGGWIVDRCVESFSLIFGGLTREDCAEVGKRGRERVLTHRTWRGAADQFRQMFHDHEINGGRVTASAGGDSE